MKNISKAFAILVISLMLIGCSTHIHHVGNGGSGAQEEARQWYVLFGLVPINNVDTNQMARGSSDYTIKTSTSFLDIVINIFTQVATVNSRTVTVTR